MRHVYVILGLLLLLGGTACSETGNSTLQLSSDADLAGLTVSCTAGNYYEHKYSAREDVKVFACNSEADAVQAVRQGLADVYVSDEVVLSANALKQLGMKMALRGEESFDVAFALRKGNSSLLEQLNEFLSSAPLDDILAHWLQDGPAVADPVPPAGEKKAPLRCIVCVNLAPVSYLGEGGQWQGMDPDLLRRFAASQGRTLEVRFQDLGSAIVALETGQADIVSGCLFVTDERKTFVDFSMPYYECHPAYFVLDKASGTRPDLKSRLTMNFVQEGRWKLIVGGLCETLKITLLSILLGTLLGVGLCAARRSRRKWLRSAADIYGTLIEGIPTLVLLLIMFYVVFAGTGVTASAVAVVTFALGFASSAGSIFDTAVSSVPRGQTEAGLSLGFTPLKTFTGIVFPQALAQGLPLYVGECVSLLKTTSIVGYIAIQDLTRASDLIRSRTFDALIPLLLVTIVYFLLAWLIRRMLNFFLVKK